MTTAPRHLAAVPSDTPGIPAPRQRTNPDATTAALRDAERIVLGAMLTNPDAIRATADILTTDQFHHPRHRTLHDAIHQAAADGTPTEPTAMTAWLLKHNLLDHVGGAAYLHDLVAAVPTTANTTWYANYVADAAAKRRLTETFTRLQQAAENPAHTAEQLAEYATEAVRVATPTPTASDDIVRLGDLAADGLQTIENRASHKPGEITGATTGLIDLDRLTGGLQPGHLVVFAGRPGMGKSVMGLDIARANAIHRGAPVFVASLEMTNDMLFERILSAESEVPGPVLKSGRLSDEQWIKVSKAAGRLSDAPMYLSDDSSATVARIENRARRVQARHGLTLVVVDYLQIVKSGRRAENRTAEVGEITRRLKALAGDLGVPVVALAQIGRGTDARADKRPMLSELRESGEIENTADLVALLYRDDYYHKDSPQTGEIEINVAKNRHGPSAVIVAAAQLHLSRFFDMAVQ